MNLLRRLALTAIFGFSLALLANVALRAQTFTQVRDSGPRANRLNIVFAAEGYTTAESAKFSADATVKIQTLLGNEAWNRFSDSINVFTLFVASAESGADDPASGTVRNTYFDSTFNYLGIDRLLALPSSGAVKLQALLTQFAPDWDVVIVLVNSTKYGGSGGTTTVVSLNTSSDEIMLHELGHSFAKLADEYVDAASAPNYPPAEFPNATQTSTRATSPWSAFIATATPIPTSTAPDENTVGMFLGAYYRATGFYRPTNNSKMNSLGRPFGPVNLRAFATEVHRQNLNHATTKPVIMTQPAGVLVAAGQPATLSVVATGTGPLTYLWRFNGVYLPTALGSTLTLPMVDAAQIGTYAVEVTNAVGTTTSVDAAVDFGAAIAPGVVSLTPFATALPGGTIVLTVAASGTGPFSYQWFKNGGVIAGATGAGLTLPNVQSSDAGNYTVRISNSAGSVTSDAAVVEVAGAIASRLSNVSVRTTLAANQILTVGFTMQGGAKSVLLRAVGPGLAPFGVTGTMPDPKLALFQGSTPVTDNDNWGGGAALSTTFASVGAFALPPASLDAALLGSVDGGHTAQISGTAGGNVLVEAYDAGSGLSPRLTNVSARNRVGTGADILIAGFTISGSGTKSLLIRAVGPSLVPLGVSDVLLDPKLQLYNANAEKIGENDTWASGLTTTFASVGAFALIPNSKDAALVVALPAGGYTVQVSGADGGSGDAVVEIYELP